MTREELKLNDFEGFDGYLKTLEIGKKSIWGTFYNEATNIFTPPIIRPMTLAEYQLDHYAFWMVIYAYGLKEKPEFYPLEYMPASKCYACEWRRRRSRRSASCNLGCPMVLNNRKDHCIDTYIEWVYYAKNESAYVLAHLPWKET